MQTESNNHIIQNIQSLGGTYDPESALSLIDQLLICESLAEATPISDNWVAEGKTQENTSVSGNGSVNGGCKQQVNFELTESKRDIIAKLQTCTYRTSPRIVADLLTQFFAEWESVSTHWLYVSQTWPPLPIKRVIREMVKRHTSGRVTIHNPAAYFTLLIKMRARRKEVLL